MTFHLFLLAATPLACVAGPTGKDSVDTNHDTDADTGSDTDTDADADSDSDSLPETRDADNDGDGLTENEGDCDDHNPAVPAAQDDCSTRYDDDCQGARTDERCYVWLEGYWYKEITIRDGDFSEGRSGVLYYDTTGAEVCRWLASLQPVAFGTGIPKHPACPDCDWYYEFQYTDYVADGPMCANVYRTSTPGPVYDFELFGYQDTWSGEPPWGGGTIYVAPALMEYWGGGYGWAPFYGYGTSWTWGDFTRSEDAYGVITLTVTRTTYDDYGWYPLYP